MTLTEDRQKAIREALDALVSCAEQARDATDTEAAKRALNTAWYAVHRATETIIDAEKATRREALDNLEAAA